MVYKELEGFELYKKPAEEGVPVDFAEPSYRGLSGFSPVEKNKELSQYEEESTGKGLARTALQAPLGYVKQWTWPMDLVNLIGTTESMQELEEWENNLEWMKKTFPDLNIPETVDREAFLQSIQGASESLPTQRNVERFIEEKTGVPLEPRTKLQKDIRLGGEAAGFKTGGVAPKAVAAVVAPSTSEGLQALGVPEEYAEGIGILLSQIPLGSLGEIADAETKALVKRAKDVGLTEREITPLLQSPTKRGLLSDVSKKGANTEALISDIQETLGNGFNELRARPEAKVPFTKAVEEKFVNRMQKVMDELPRGLQKTVQEDFNDLIQRPITTDSTLNFWQDMNYYISKGEGRLGVFKGPMKEAFVETSPKLASDIDLTNRLYGKFAGVRKDLSPKLIDTLIKAGKVIGVAGSVVKNIVTGNFPALATELTAIVGIDAGRRLATQMLTNPNLYNLSSKLATATEESIPYVLSKMSAEINKIDPELGKELSFDGLSQYLLRDQER